MDRRVAAAPESDAGAARRRRLAIIGMLGTMAIYGANFSISRHGILNGLTAYDLMALRFSTAGLIMLPIFLSRTLASCGGIGWRHGLVLAIMSGAPMSWLQIGALAYSPAAHGASIAPGTVTVVGVIGSVLLFGAALTRNLVLGILAVIAGLATLAVAGHAAGPDVLTGDLMFLAVGLIWGSYPLLIQLWKIDALRATAVVSVLSLAYLPFYFAFWFRGFDVAPWWVLALHAFNQGVLNVVVGLWIWGWGARVLGAAVVGRFPPLIPVFGVLLAIPILGEIPTGLQGVGFLLVIGGLVLASLRRGPPPTPS